jgi:transposase
MQYIAFDSHKHYTLVSVEEESGELVCERRIAHERGAIREFLMGFDPGSPVAVETIGNWYWIVEEIEEAGMVPRLVHARKAKLMMGHYNKNDRLDARGMNLLQRVGTLPTVWIPSGEIRDLRDLPRTRMVLVKERTQLKNRIHSTLAKYAISVGGVRDIFGVKGRRLIDDGLSMLPPHTRFSVRGLLSQLDSVSEQIARIEDRMREVFKETRELEVVMTLPGVGFILGTVVVLEVGDIGRFRCAEKFASYAGTVPRERSSGGKVRFGRLRPDVNRYLKWAYVEAANVVSLNRRHWRGRHVCDLYERVLRRRGHQKAIGAVARHLAEATWWMLTKGEEYREPNFSRNRFVHGRISAKLS